MPIALFGATKKVVVFDYGGVIADANYYPLVDFLSKTIGAFNSPLQDKDTFKESLNKPASYWKAYAERSLSESWVYNFEKNQQYLIVPIPGMHELIQKLKQRKVPVVLLSNTTHARAAYLTSQGAYSLFNPTLLSCNLGIRKPHKKIYEILLKTLDIPPQNCLFIDDKLRNIRAAKELGIDGIHFRSVGELKRELLDRGIAL